jgi:TIR domain-containing protein
VVSDHHQYDVAVSFASAQRAYVEEFVDSCRRRGLTVFYDRDMAVAYWGRNFIYEFRKVYGGSAARFVMPFISAEYLATPYPRDELAAAVEQGFRRPGQTYLLPVVVGDVAIPPELLNPAVGLLRADDHTPSELAAMTVQRLEVAESDAGGRPGPRTPPAAAPATGRRSRLSARRSAVAGLAALVVAGLAVVIRMSGLLPSGASESGPDASASTPTAGPKATSSTDSVSCGRPETTAVIKPGPDSGAVDVSLLEVGYQVHERPGSEVYLDLAGQVRGRADRNAVLWIVGTADPTTHDSSPKQVYGSTRYHVVEPVKTDGAGCWTITGHKVGYSCAGGLTFRYYLAVLSPQQAQEMPSLDLRQDGFTEQDIVEDRQIPLLSTFDVPTESNC